MTLYEYIPRHEYTTNFVLLQPIHLLHRHPHHLFKNSHFPTSALARSKRWPSHLVLEEGWEVYTDVILGRNMHT